MKCPHCEQPIASLTIAAMDGGVPLGAKFKCVAYGCPRCQKMISAQIDPVAIKTDTIDKIKAIFGR